MYLTLSPYAKKILWKKIFFNLKWSSLAVQWLRLCASNAGGTGLISDKVAKTPHAAWYSQKKKKKTLMFHSYGNSDITNISESKKFKGTCPL